MMHRVLMANSAAGEHLEGVVALARLGEQFRRDVHAASAAKIEKDGDQFRKLELDDSSGGQIEYEICPEGLRRTVLRSAQPQARELFVLAGMKVQGWNEDAATTGELAMRISRLARRGADETTTGRPFSIAAAVGRDRTLGGLP
jgi:hypothetical protein